jgi:putative phosphoribosyl transferase
MIFDDRHDAGRRLAAVLTPLKKERPLVFAVPRGGVPVAAEVAVSLGLPLDLITVRKLGSPQNPELAVGAIAEDGTAVYDPTLMRHLQVTEGELTEIREREERELARRLKRFRVGSPRLDVRGRTVLIVDDGLATGLTDLAAVRAMRAMGATRILLAAPVGSSQAVDLIAREADQVICLQIPQELYGIGAWYRDFSPVEDGEVLLELSRVATATPSPATARGSGEVVVASGAVALPGDLSTPHEPMGLVIFAHGSGSSRLSSRNIHVARLLNDRGLATLLFDLLTEQESSSRELVFDIPLLTSRLEAAVHWAASEPLVQGLPIGLFGASTGAAAALSAAANLGQSVHAVVSRGGRPDLAIDLARVSAPTLLIVGSRDIQVLELNRLAANQLRCPNQIDLVEGATHLFEEPGALDNVADLAGGWFLSHMKAAPPLSASR